MNADSFKHFLTSQYHLQVDEEAVDNQFIYRQLNVKDMDKGRGLQFSVGFNSSGRASALVLAKAKLDRFNIAEGYSPEDILKVAEDILEGNFTEGRTPVLRVRKLLFNTSRGVLKATLKTSDRFRAYRKK
jgi:hypothetical protein